MQAVADLKFLQVAQVIVELEKLFAFILAVLDAAVLRDPGPSCRCQDICQKQRVRPRPVHAGGLVIFVHLRFEFGHHAVTVGLRHRRRQMVEDHRRRPPLRLRSLAGVIDDKGIEVRQRAKNGFRQACLTERKRLAGKPFQIAVLAEMHHGMHPKHLAKPDIEREIVVRRHQIGRMVGRLRIDVVSARRLDPDNHIAIASKREMKPFSIAHRIVIRRAPSFGDGIAHRLRKRSELRPVNFERQADIADRPCHPALVGPAFICAISAALSSGGPATPYPASASERMAAKTLSGVSSPTPFASLPSRFG